MEPYNLYYTDPYNLFVEVRKDISRIKTIKNKITKIEIYNCFDPHAGLCNLLKFNITHENSFTNNSPSSTHIDSKNQYDSKNNITHFTLNCHAGYYWVNDSNTDDSKLFIRSLDNYYISKEEDLIDGELPDEKEYLLSNDDFNDEINVRTRRCQTDLQYYFFENMLKFVEKYCHIHDIYECNIGKKFIEDTIDDIKVVFYY